MKRLFDLSRNFRRDGGDGEETQIKGLGWELPRELWAVLLSDFESKSMHWWMRRPYSSESSIVTFLSMLSFCKRKALSLFYGK